MTKIAISPTFFQGHVSLEKKRTGLKPWRLPFALKALFPSPDDTCAVRAEFTSGVRLRLKTKSRTLALRVAPFSGDRFFDLVIDNEIIQTLVLKAQEETLILTGLPGRMTVLEIWFPPQAPVEVRGFAVEKSCSCLPARDPRKRWVAYGSSITQCSGAASPAAIWTGVASRLLDLNLTSIGLGGQCHIDPMFARTIRDLPADFITLKLGINVYGGGSLNARTYSPAIIGSIMTIREKHPKTPLLLISPVCSPPRESTQNVVGVTLEMMRTQMEEACQRIIQATRDRNLYYLNGLKLADADFTARHMPDALHPNGAGYMEMGKNFVEALPPRIRAIGKD